MRGRAPCAFHKTTNNDMYHKPLLTNSQPYSAFNIHIMNTALLADAPAHGDYAEALERLNNSLDNDNGCAYPYWTRFINDIEDDLHATCSYLKNKDDINSDDAELLYRLGPVFREVIESDISPDLREEDADMVQNTYEYKARYFLYEFYYVLSWYSTIFEEKPDFIRYKVDQEFVEGWHDRVYPSMQMGDYSWYRWSWPDDGWIMCSCEGE